MSSSRCARWRRCPGSRPATIIGSSRFSIALSVGMRLKNWNTKPTFSRRYFSSARSAAPTSSSPSTTTLPPVGRSTPPSRLSSVVLPQPLGPMMATAWPGSTDQSRPRSAWTSSAAVR
jgi:hypothetical protein